MHGPGMDSSAIALRQARAERPLRATLSRETNARKLELIRGEQPGDAPCSGPARHDFPRVAHTADQARVAPWSARPRGHGCPGQAALVRLAPRVT
jgi:hypothetical protein